MGRELRQETTKIDTVARIVKLILIEYVLLLLCWFMPLVAFFTDGFTMKESALLTYIIVSLFFRAIKIFGED